MPVPPAISAHALQFMGAQQVHIASLTDVIGDGRSAARSTPQMLTHGVGKGPAVLRKQWALDSTQNIQNPPFSRRKNLNSGGVPLIIWFDPPDNETKRPFQPRLYKTGPAFALSKTIRDKTYDEFGVILPFCKVLVFRTSDNVLIARTVSDANGDYSVTVPS